MADDDLNLISGNAHPRLSEVLAEALGIDLSPAKVTAFADGETQVHIEADVRGATVCLVQPLGPPVNENVMALALLIDAARTAGAGRVVAVAPYLGYSRQEVRSRRGEPRSAQVVARLFAAVGLDHLLTIDPHVPALESAFSMPLTMIPAADVLLEEIRDWKLEQPVVVSPDAGGLKRAQRFARALEADVALVTKDRPRPDAAEPRQVLGDVRGRACLMVDDLASTARTLARGAEALREAGAREVHAAFTHPVMAEDAIERLLGAPIERLLTTNSIPAPAHERLHVVSVAPALAKAVRAVA